MTPRPPDRRGRRAVPRRFSFALASLLLVTVVAACGPSGGEREATVEAAPSDTPAPTPEPRAILEQAATALQAVDSVRYDFSYGGPDDPTGWLSGTVWMRQGPDAARSWIRVEGTVHPQPERGLTERAFAYGRDGRIAWSVEGDGELETAPVGAGANRLSATAVYAWLPELVESEPLWRELGMAQELDLLEPVTLDGQTCDVVRVVLDLEQGPDSEIHWAIARGDRLPRRGRWFMPRAGPEGMVLTLENLETGIDLVRADFAPPAAGGEVAAALDIPWQPGIAVIGPRGTVLYKQLGASADRVARVRAAIEEGLGRLPASS